MADMLTFKEINLKNYMKKDLEKKLVPSPTMHEELQEVEGTLYFDGAFKRSINKGAAGYVFFDKNGIEVWFGSQEVDVNSNNEAEYASLCVGLNECIKRHVKKLLIKGDSMLVIRQIQGPLPGTRNGKNYILSAVDYMTKWPKAKASRGATSKDACNSIFDCICCRFGVPFELVSDQGKDFRNDLIQDLVKKLEIKHRYSTPYHPQCNGLVEAFNGVLHKILFKLVEEHPKDWDMYLERALWACRVTQKLATGFTPFHLVYGEECVMPINVLLSSLDFILKHNLIEEEQMKKRVASMHTLLLDRENAIKYYENMSQKRADVSNNKIKAKEICKGMLQSLDLDLESCRQYQLIKVLLSPKSMGSENGAEVAALTAGAEMAAQSEPDLYKDGAVDDGVKVNTESTSVVDVAHDVQGGFANGANADVGSGWLNATSSEENGSGWISAEGTSVNLPPPVVSQPWPSPRQQRTIYLIRIPRSVDEKLRNEIKLAETRLEQSIKKRDIHKAALQAKKNIKMDLLEKLKPIREKERACREATQGKRMELEPFSAALNKFRSAKNRGQDICSSEEELNDKIAEIQFRIQHESIPLKEEKQLLREIKQLESTRGQVCANSVLQAELMENLGPKEEIQDQAKFLRQDLDSIRKEHQQARVEYDALDREINKVNEAIEELRQQYEKANAAQQDAYAAVRELKRQENLKNDPFYQNKRDVQVVRDLASQRKAKEVDEICTKQVEDFMIMWNKDSKFRADYVKSNERSTARRLETLDGRSLGPNEKPPVLSDDVSSLKPRDAKSPADTPAPGPSKVTKSFSPAAELSNGVLVKDSKQEKLPSVHSRDDEAGDAGIRDTHIKSRQIDATRDVADLEAQAAEQKERLRQEQIAKAKEAEERKRKRSDKLESRALARAKKDAERKEKEKEKKAQRKAASATNASSSADPTEAADRSGLFEQKPHADAEPVAASEEDSKNNINSGKDKKGNAGRRKLLAKDVKPMKPTTSKRSLKKTAWPAPLWAIASISALVLFVALILFMKL
ncbi:hypothetical protein L7F22_044968 [Adiantum nelumboides]|nr:hypothetical protein [Adiantum nelumboides]